MFRTQPEGARTGPGDTDLVIYSLRQWLSLAVAGNPSVLLLFWVPDDALIVRTEEGDRLRALAPRIFGRRPRFRSARTSTRSTTTSPRHTAGPGGGRPEHASRPGVGALARRGSPRGLRRGTVTRGPPSGVLPAEDVRGQHTGPGIRRGERA